MLFENPRRARVRYALEHIAATYKDFEDFNNDYWTKCIRGTYYVGVPGPRFTIDNDIRNKITRGEWVISCSPEGAIKRQPDTGWIAEVQTLPEQVIEKVPGRNEDIKVRYPDLIFLSRVLDRQRAINSFKYQQRFLPASEQELYFAWERAKRNVEIEAQRKEAAREREKKRQARRREKRRKERARKRRQ